MKQNRKTDRENGGEIDQLIVEDFFPEQNRIADLEG